MKNLLRHLLPANASTTPALTRNHAGGLSFSLDPWQRLERFLVLGADGGTYYVSERTLTRESAAVVLECLSLDAPRAVATISAISRAGRAPKNTPALFALALAFTVPAAVPHARAALPSVARTGTHLFQFVDAVRALRGFGRALRGALADWYLRQPVEALAYQLVKYRQRERWTHRDVLRLAHPCDAERDALFRWAVGREATGLPPLVEAFDAAAHAPLEALPALVRQHGLTHEMLPSEALTSAPVLEALAGSMPLGALVRFLGRFSRAGLVAPDSTFEASLCARLTDRDALHRARPHPLALLVALRTYSAGQGTEGRLSWPVSSAVVAALEAAMQLAFDAVTPSGTRTLVALDVSGSMGAARCAGARALTCAEGAAAMALVTLRTEPVVHLKAFSHTLVDVRARPHGSLTELLSTTRGMTFGSTDCAQPMLWAHATRTPIDTFVVLTDNETWFGAVHPHVALQQYREALGIAARLVVVGMASTRFTIADPSDPASLDVVGFDTATPGLISDFAAGRIGT